MHDPKCTHSWSASSKSLSHHRDCHQEKRKKTSLCTHLCLAHSSFSQHFSLTASNSWMPSLFLCCPTSTLFLYFFMSPHALLFLSSHTLPPGIMTMEILFWEPHVVTAWWVTAKEHRVDTICQMCWNNLYHSGVAVSRGAGVSTAAHSDGLIYEMAKPDQFLHPSVSLGR